MVGGEVLIDEVAVELVLRRRRVVELVLELRYAVEDALPLVRQVVATEGVEGRAYTHL